MSHNDQAIVNGNSQVPASGSTVEQPPTTFDRHVRMLCASGNPMQSSVTGTWRRQGRGIRRLVALTDNIYDLVNEADRRGAMEWAVPHSTPEEDRLFKSYERLVDYLPEFKEYIASPTNKGMLGVVIRQLTEGADSARADDAALLKVRVVSWLTGTDSPRLSPYDKSGRGFHNNSTARLICPVDFDWDNVDLRSKIQDWHPDYLVTAHSWPRFLYEDNSYDANDPAKGLFKGPLLVRAFKLVFTSPSSADGEDPTPDPTLPVKRHRGERRTRSHVARLINMKVVEPRAIAYIATQLRFALSDCGSWRLVDGLFDHNEFYHSIIRWFEETENPQDKAFVNNLLLWWTREVFGREGVVNYAIQPIENMSVAVSFKRRCTNRP